MSSNGSVVISYELNREEVISVMRWQAIHLYRLRLMVGFSVAILACGVVVLSVHKAPIVVPLVLFAMGAMQLLMCGWFYYGIPPRAWKKAAPSRSTITLQFGDQGVNVHTAKSDAQNKWSVYSEVLERDDMYLLRIGERRLYTIIPKRSFQSPSDEQRFRDLVGQHTASSLPASSDRV